MKIPRDSLKNKVALVTGGGSGIGEASALALAQAGARIALLDLSKEDLKESAKKIDDAGGESLCLEADVSDFDAMSQAVEQIREAWGRLDIVFANAGINGVWAPIDELSVEEWDKTMTVNLKGTFITVKTSLGLLKKEGGSIIITSSVNGTRMFSNTGASAYSTSKAGQLAFARMMAPELAEFGIRVNTICPGAISTSIGERTEQRDLEHIRLPVKFPKGQIPLTGDEPGSAEQVALTVWFLASDASSHVTGAEIFIDGGQSLFQG